MGLKSYQDTFMTERINGEMLLECDDEVLQEELKVIHYCSFVGFQVTVTKLYIAYS